MRALPTNPTVQDLLDARQSFTPAVALRSVPPGPEGLLFEALRRHVRPGAVVLRHVPVVTAEGRLVVPIVVSTTGYGIAIVSESGDVEASAREAAVLLVSGPFDAVYRAPERALAHRVTAVAWEIARREPRLFLEPDRDILRLCASTIARRARAADRAAISHLAVVPAPDVRPMRLNRPSEWSGPYEDAMRAIEARQIPLFARSA